MQPMYVSIQQDATGRRIKELLKEKGFTVREVQETMGFENPQAVYKWLSGKSLPSLDNLVILSRLLQTNIENILVIDEDIAAPVIIREERNKITKIKACSDGHAFCVEIFGKLADPLAGADLLGGNRSFGAGHIEEKYTVPERVWANQDSNNRIVLENQCYSTSIINKCII